jgi:hypothetical protein
MCKSFETVQYIVQGLLCHAFFSVLSHCENCAHCGFGNNQSFEDWSFGEWLLSENGRSENGRLRRLVVRRMVVRGMVVRRMVGVPFYFININLYKMIC